MTIRQTLNAFTYSGSLHRNQTPGRGGQVLRALPVPSKSLLQHEQMPRIMDKNGGNPN